MYKFKNHFRQINPGEGYDGAMDLLSGESPLIYEVDKGDTLVSVIVSGTGCNETLISILINDKDKDSEYICSVPGYNTIAKVSADYIVDTLLEARDLVETAMTLVSEFDMSNCMEVSHV